MRNAVKKLCSMAMVAALVLTMLPLGMLAGTTEVSAATRTITVINGTADGKAADHMAANAIVRVKANNPGSNEKFTHWTVNEGTAGRGFNKTAKEFNMRMPDGHVTLEAHFEKISGEEPGAPSLVVKDGQADPAAPTAGSAVSVSPKTIPGKVFSHWTLDKGTIANFAQMNKNVPLRFQMPNEEVVLTAHFVEDPATLDKAKLTVVHGKALPETPKSNEKVRVTAERISGKVFTHWTVEGATLAFDEKQETIEFTMPNAAVTLTANYEAEKKAAITKAQYSRTEFTTDGGRVSAKLEGENLLKLKESEVAELFILDKNGQQLKTRIPIRLIKESDSIARLTFDLPENSDHSTDMRYILRLSNGGNGYLSPATVPGADQIFLVKHDDSGISVPQFEEHEYIGIYTAETITLKNFPVVLKGSNTKVSEPVKFRFFNTQLQTFESEVVSENGVLPNVPMRKGHFYIVYAEDANYRMAPQYIKLDNDGGIPVMGPQKTYDPVAPQVKAFAVEKRATPSLHPENDKRVHCRIPVFLNDRKTVAPVGIKITLTSAYEEIEVVTNETGVVEFDLIEDLNYTVNTNDEKYAIPTFPMTVKDHSENDWPKIPYMHFTCVPVDEFILVEGKEAAHKRDMTLESPSKRSHATGANFRYGRYFLNDRVLPKDSVKGIVGDYEVIDVDPINMYRGEISKLAKGEFKCSWKVADGKKVKAVYYVDNAGELKPVKWTQDGDTVHYEMDSLGLYNNVIRYADPATEYHFVGSSSDVWKKGSESALEFRVKAEDYDENTFEKFAGIEVDDRTVGAENYETAKGSIIIRLKPSYLKTLANGPHMLKVKFSDGKEVTKRFTVEAAEGEQSQATTQTGKTVAAKTKATAKTGRVAGVKTGDSADLYRYGVIAIAALIATAFTMTWRRKRQQ